MAFLMIEGERYALSSGDTILGGRSDELLASSPLAALTPFATLTSDGESMVIRAIGSAMGATINGEPLGASPRMLNHGDQIGVGALVVHVGDLRAAGRTARAAGVSEDQASTGVPPASANPTAATGGRLTSVEGGSVHAISSRGLVIGRDPDCDIVLDSREVSRRHASITPGLLGYTLRDESTNGVLVNGERVDRTHLLGQGDVVRIADMIYRFTADRASFEPGAELWDAEPVPLVETELPNASIYSPPTAPSLRQQRVEPVPPATVLATLEARSGSIPAGTRFPLVRPVAQLGRGAGSDVCLVDDSVSGAHATLILRGATWHLIDHASRNGTYVDGQRVNECVLPGPCELRLGAVTLHFVPQAAAAPSTIGTLGLIGLTDEQIGKRSPP